MNNKSEVVKSYLVETVPSNGSREDYAIHHDSDITIVIQALTNEIDKDGYVEVVDARIIKFISPSDMSSHWIITEYI